MNMDRTYIELFCIYLGHFVNFYVFILSGWTPNCEFFGVHTSSVDLKYLPNIGPPRI